MVFGLFQVLVGFMMNIIGILVLIFGTETWGASVFDFRTLPDVFNTYNSTVLQNSSLPINGSCICSNLTVTWHISGRWRKWSV